MTHLLNEEAIRQQCHKAKSIPIEILSSIGSTNDYAKTLPLIGPIQFCLAEHQTQGRGRFARPFVSPFGANIYLSCRWEIQKDIRQLAGLSLMVSVSIVKALQILEVQDAKIKWPNDILIDDKKLAGVLIEASSEGHGNTQVIIGIGLNVNMPKHILDTIDRPVTSLNILLDGLQDRNRVAAILIEQLTEDLQVFSEQGFAPFQEMWPTYDALTGKTITLINGNQTISGSVIGIDKQGHLLLKTKDGVHPYSAGETTMSKAA